MSALAITHTRKHTHIALTNPFFLKMSTQTDPRAPRLEREREGEREGERERGREKIDPVAHATCTRTLTDSLRRSLTGAARITHTLPKGDTYPP